MTFAQTMKKLMDEKALTNYQLAKALDVHPTTVANWLDGKTPRKKTVAMLAEYFGVSVDYLLTGEIQKAPPADNDEERELMDYLEVLRTRPECRMLMKTAKGATKEQVEANVKFIESLRGYNSDD